LYRRRARQQEAVHDALTRWEAESTLKHSSVLHMVAKSGVTTVKPALLIGPKMVCLWQCLDQLWLHGLQGEGESSMLVLWVASQAGREGGKSLASVSIQANGLVMYHISHVKIYQ